MMGWQDRDYHREDGKSGQAIPPINFAFPPLTHLTAILIAINLVVFIAQAATAPFAGASPLVEHGALSFEGYRAWIQPWRWITYQYLHGSGGHVFFNCIGIYFFLPPLARHWGWKKALAFYSLGGIASGVLFWLMCMAFGFGRLGSLIGASGSVFACMGACALLFPGMCLIFFIIQVPIRIAAVLFAVLFLLTIAGDKDLSAAAHLGGLAFGFFAPMTRPWFSRIRYKYEAERAVKEMMHEQQEQETIDQILAKVHAQGMQSLTGGERRALERATERQRQRDAQRASRKHF